MCRRYLVVDRSTVSRRPYSVQPTSRHVSSEVFTKIAVLFQMLRTSPTRLFKSRQITKSLLKQKNEKIELVTEVSGNFQNNSKIFQDFSKEKIVDNFHDSIFIFKVNTVNEHTIITVQHFDRTASLMLLSPNKSEHITEYRYSKSIL